MERASAVTAFRPRRNLGVSLTPHGGQWGAQLGLFGKSLGSQSPDHGGISLDMRMHAAPLLSDGETLHLGFNFRHRMLEDDGESFGSRGEATRPEERLVRTPFIRDVDSFSTYGPEFYYQRDRFSLMAEWQQNHVVRNAAADLNHQGGYVAALWSLTGEHRRYDAAAGTYRGISPDSPVTAGSAGAWEIGLRQSVLDLNDADIRGGRVDSTSLGLNWYPADEVKLMVNYIYHELDASAAYPNRHLHYLLFRTQLKY